MGEVRRPKPVNLVCAVLAGRHEWLANAKDRLETLFGPLDLESDVWPFDHTDYYEAEMGPSLLRQLLGFRELMMPDDLRTAKLSTNRLERELSCAVQDGPRRPVNLDPGYVCEGKLVLATTKDHAHRVYLGSGIYAECTLHWQNGAFVPWEWTYPDYGTAAYRDFFAQVRRLHREKLRRAAPGRSSAPDR